MSLRGMRGSGRGQVPEGLTSGRQAGGGEAERRGHDVGWVVFAGAERKVLHAKVVRMLTDAGSP